MEAISQGDTPNNPLATVDINTASRYDCFVIKNCELTGSVFEITEEELDFLKKVSPVFNERTYPIPTPRLCPQERQRRRLAFRNESALYHRKCDFTGKKIISRFPEGGGIQVYESSRWHGDGWSGFDYAREFDFSKPFFEQFLSLRRAAPNAIEHIRSPVRSLNF